MASPGSWIKAMRLRTLPLSLATVLTGNFLAMPGPEFSYLVFILTILTTIFLQILSNLANDLGDYLKGSDNEKRIGPSRTTQSGEITVSEMKKAISVLIIFSLACGITLLVFSKLDTSELIVFFVTGILAILAAVFYTMGKKPYGYRAMGDLGVFLFFGIVGVCGSFYLQTGFFFKELLLPAVGIGLFSVAVLNMNNMRDIENDRENHKNTLVVLLGWKMARVYHTFLIGAGWIAVFIFSYYVIELNWKHSFLLIPFLVFVFNLKNVWQVSSPKDLDPELKKIALATFIFSLVFGYSLV